MEIREISLHKGPADGTKSMASHDTCVAPDNEIYVWDGGEDKDRFVHAKTALLSMKRDEFNRELALIQKWLADPGTPSGSKHQDGTPVMVPAPMSMCVGIPPWRINAWRQLCIADQIAPLVSFSEADSGTGTTLDV